MPTLQEIRERLTSDSEWSKIVTILDINGFKPYIPNDRYTLCCFQKKLGEEYNISNYLCTTNESVSIHVKLYQLDAQFIELSRSMQIELVHNTKNNKWVDFKFYSLSVDEFVESYYTMINKLVECWKVVYEC